MLVRVGYLVEINGIYSAGIVLKVVITVVTAVIQTTLVSIVLCITHVLILVLLILWLYITFVITPSKPLDYPVTLSINNTLR